MWPGISPRSRRLWPQRPSTDAAGSAVHHSSGPRACPLAARGRLRDTTGPTWAMLRLDGPLEPPRLTAFRGRRSSTGCRSVVVGPVRAKEINAEVAAGTPQHRVDVVGVILSVVSTTKEPGTASGKYCARPRVGALRAIHTFLAPAPAKRTSPSLGRGQCNQGSDSAGGRRFRWWRTSASAAARAEPERSAIRMPAAGSPSLAPA